MDARSFVRLALLGACLAWSGCQTVYSYSQGDVSPYSGICRTFEGDVFLLPKARIRAAGVAGGIKGLSVFKPIVYIDFPFSFVLDTAMLPVTVPVWSIRKAVEDG